MQVIETMKRWYVHCSKVGCLLFPSRLGAHYISGLPSALVKKQKHMYLTNKDVRCSRRDVCFMSMQIALIILKGARAQKIGLKSTYLKI